MQLAFPVRRSTTSSLVALTVAILSACSDSVGPSGDAASGDDVLLGRGKKTPTAPAPTPTPPSAGNPLAGVSLFVDPSSKASQTASAWRATRPADAAQMDKIAAQSQAKWFGNWNADVRADVDRAVTTAGNAMAVLVAYNIPQRDCGGYSSGGANNPDGYRAWIDAFAAGIGGRRAIVILEPDALPGLDCLAAPNQQTRTDLLAYAVNTFRSLGATAVYLDAGHSRWKSAATMASRLIAAGIEFANGFSLNVSNFHYTAEQITYGNSVSSLAGGKHYVIDTSRNGLGATSDSEWCNPEGRALGEQPTSATGNALVDAFLWVKVPGESDGNCNGNPSAGTWMPEYALGLAQRAAY